MTSRQMTSTSARSMATRRIAVTTFALGLFCAPVTFSQTASTPTPAAQPAATDTDAKPAAAVPPAGAKAFATAQAAANALIQAATTFDEPALIAMFGPDGKDLVTHRRRCPRQVVRRSRLPRWRRKDTRSS